VKSHEVLGFRVTVSATCSAERQAERRFLADYLGWVSLALQRLTPATAEAVRTIADAANHVLGYAHVRQWPRSGAP
jgi:hypothetical protein